MSDEAPMSDGAESMSDGEESISDDEYECWSEVEDKVPEVRPKTSKEWLNQCWLLVDGPRQRYLQPGKVHIFYNALVRQSALSLVQKLVDGTLTGIPRDHPRISFHPEPGAGQMSVSLPNILELLLCHRRQDREFRDANFAWTVDERLRGQSVACTIELLLAMGMPPDGCARGTPTDMGLLHLLASGGCQPYVWDDTPAQVMHDVALARVMRLCAVCGADVELEDVHHEASPLGWACWFGSPAGARFMLQVGADMHAQNTYGSTPDQDSMARHEWLLPLRLGEWTDNFPDSDPQFPSLTLLDRQTAEENVLALRRVHGQWAESESRVAAALAASAVGQACEALTQRMLPGPALQVVANAVMVQLVVLWRPVTRPVVMER